MAATATRKKTVVSLTIAAVAGLIALLIALVSVPDGGESSAAGPAAGAPAAGDAATPEPGSDPLDAAIRRDPGDPLAKGAVDAPVVMVSYSDFQCPFCGKFARDTEPELVRKYVDEGVLRIEWRDFPYLGAESVTAARAGRAAAAQGQFWEFHDKLYADPPAPNTGRLTEGYLIGIAGELGLDVEKFRTDMQSKEVAQAVEDDFTQGQHIGVTGTPAFLVNGRPIMGAQPIQVFEMAIDQAAAEATGK